jgi:hypothetical protein
MRDLTPDPAASVSSDVVGVLAIALAAVFFFAVAAGL